MAYRIMKNILLIAVTLVLAGLAQIGVPARAAANDIPNPILFVTQVPVNADFTTIGSVFGNQRADMESVARGGDMWIRYPDGSTKNLTQAAGYGVADGFQGQNAIAVRDPAVAWDGTRALFSMVMGAPTAQYDYEEYFWQLYEIRGLGKNDTPVITRVPNQPQNANNISPLYGTDDRILFTSDRPRDGSAHLYPQLDEYEEAPTVSGIWSLNPQTGDLFMLNHAPSGAFTPILDSYGRVIFTRWDHLQRDQQADTDREQGAGFDSYGQGCTAYCTFNYASEAADAEHLRNRDEVYPEPRGGDQVAGTNLWGHTFNHFTPWQMNEDGTEEETLNHLGRHELVGYIPPSLTDDPNLYEYYGQEHRANPNAIENFLQVKEDPTQPGRYFGIDAPEFQTHASGQVISINAAPDVNPDTSVITYWTHRDTASYSDNPSPNHSGHYRDPLPLTSGTILVAHTAATSAAANDHNNYDFRLEPLVKLANNFWGAGAPLTNGISKNIWWWSPDYKVTFSGKLWELQPVEVVARTKPARRSAQLAPPEATAIRNAGAAVGELQSWMRQNGLALLVSRDVTQRDDFDKQQPYNLLVPGGKQTLGADGKTYTLKYLQLFQADLIRGVGGVQDPRPGRRVLAQPLHDANATAANDFAASAPPASVTIAADGSVAAFVPARRALSWQTTDSAGVDVVRERMWLTMQPGEIRACTSCHGVNDKDQAGNPPAENVPQALFELVKRWQAEHGAGCSVKPAQPALIAPANNAQQRPRKVALDWSDVPCATKYKVEVRAGSNQGTVVDRKKNLTTSNYQTIKLARKQTFYWRVKACSALGCRASEWASFRVN